LWFAYLPVLAEFNLTTHFSLASGKFLLAGFKAGTVKKQNDKPQRSAAYHALADHWVLTGI